MNRTEAGTSVGVTDPYAYVERCDHCTDEGRCRFAIEQADPDPPFAQRLRDRDYQCPVVGDADEPGLAGPWDWQDCPHMRARNRARECVRCGLQARRVAHTDDRPLLEEHHLSYADDGERPSHEITIYLCRWCHAKVHDSWASVDDPASPEPEAVAELESRRSREQDELSFGTAAERRDE